MYCPNCAHKMVKGNLAESCWACPSCEGRYFIVQTKAPNSKHNDLLLLYLSGHRVKAIMEYRNRSGMGIADSKRHMDNWAAEFKAKVGL